MCRRICVIIMGVIASTGFASGVIFRRFRSICHSHKIDRGFLVEHCKTTTGVNKMGEKPLQVLLIEDNPGDFRLIQEMFKESRANVELKWAKELSSGLAYLKEGTFDGLLVDLGFPGNQGIDTFKKIHDQAPQIPIVVLTGLANDTLALRAVGGGAQDYLVKNQIDSNLLIRAIHYAIERKRAEEALLDSEQRFRNLVENAPDVIYTLAPDGKITSLNPAFERITRWPRSNWLYKHFTSILHPDDLSRGLEFFQRIMKGEKIAPFQLRVLRKSGDYLVAEFMATPHTKNGFVIGMLGIGHDITERKRIEVALRESEERFRELYDNAPVGYFEYNTEGRITNVNRTEIEMLGYTLDDMVGKPVWEFIVEGEAARQQILAKLSGAMPPARGLERTYRRKDGTTFPAIFEDRLLQDEKGDIKGIRATIQDITERKQTEEALRSSEEKYRTILENIEDGYYEVDIAGNLTFFNDSFCRIYGYPREELMGMNDRQYTDQENAKELFQTFNKLYRTGEPTKGFDWEIIRKDGTKRCIDASVSLMKDSSGNRIGFRGIVRDVTERTQADKEMAILQEQLRHSQKMEAIGQLAGGVAHDFNNLLTLIKGYSQLSLQEIKEDSPLKLNIEEIRRAADKAADLTRQLLAFSRRQIMEMKVLDLNTILRNLDKMLRRVIGEDIELVTILAEDLGRVKADIGQIEQVVMNLSVNARDAMPQGGKLIIETVNVGLDGKYARNHIAVKPGRYAMLSVSDTGAGMTSEVRDRVFEPFFTTKEKGKGTGLGLSTVYGIVKQSGGNIWVYSEPGKGTTFKIYLPSVDEPLEELGERVKVKEIPRGTETILIVEDEEKVRKLAVRILEKQGYKVLEASQGLDAFLIVEEYEDLIHLLVTDVVMPKISGREMADRIAEIRPEIKVLYMSGYTDNATIHHGVLGGGMKFIQKPFTVEGLARKVREVLDK